MTGQQPAHWEAQLDRDHYQQPVSADRYNESYFLSACEGYQEFVCSEGRHLSRRLEQAFEAAEVAAGMRVLDIGCGRGEILCHCAKLGAKGYGIDYSAVAARMASRLTEDEGGARVGLADAKLLPFASRSFDRVLMFDLVEHLRPWELQQALAEARRVLRPRGRLIIHTAPNAWYDRYAYPVVRFVRTLMGEGEHYPRDPRALTPANLDVHVNEQSALSLRDALNRAHFRAQVWLDTPPQNRDENIMFQIARHVLFNWPPFRWFFEREVFAVASINENR
jgi:cyclopropane fatty-acyl-phospholipid synthase-like methyltransferase